MFEVLDVKRRVTRQAVRIDYVCHGIGHVELRRLDAARDSFVALTAMLHRAFAPFGATGLNCTCVDQSVEITRLRATRGDCHVAVCEGGMVGTMTLYAQTMRPVGKRARRDQRLAQHRRARGRRMSNE
ncbi:hypothetical protein B0G69_3480 [Paraburkholderia sp. RAU2J]|nr:hypothetical protein B0G69_3480 [Paraburkholderia sp. RAU2J]